MKKFLTVAAAACVLALGLWATPAPAAPRDRIVGSGFRGGAMNRGGGVFRGGGVYRTGYRGYRGYGSPYVGVGLYNAYPNNGYDYPLQTGYVVPGAYQMPLVSGTTPPSGIRQASYSPAETANLATINVALPDPNAKVFFDDSATMEKGTDRVFTSPPLDPSKSYTYTVKATWMKDGQEIEKTRDVQVQAGKDAKVDFNN